MINANRQTFPGWPPYAIHLYDLAVRTLDHLDKLQKSLGQLSPEDRVKIAQATQKLADEREDLTRTLGEQE